MDFEPSDRAKALLLGGMGMLTALSTERDKVRGLIPKEALVTDKIVGVDQIMAEAIANKFLTKPLTKDQLAELIRIDDLK